MHYPLRFGSVAFLFLIFLDSGATAWQPQPEDSPASIPDTKLTTVQELLNGYNAAELAAIQKRIPHREEPDLLEAVPRIATVSGKVFADSNANGKLDNQEAAIGGITLSDGQRILRTDATGSFRFTLRFDDTPHHRFIVMTRPTGYRPTGAFFLRIRYDQSETDYRMNFGLIQDSGDGKPGFWFISASDSQFTSVAEMLPIAKDYAQITSAPGFPAFMVTAGDLTMNGSQYEWDMYDYIRQQSHIPIYEGFGGHDGNCLDPRCTLNFEQRIGPPFYSWDYKGVHFIQLVTETGYLQTPARIRQQEWLIADLEALAPDTPVVAISHYPLDASWFDKRRQEGINVICQIGAHWHVVHTGSRDGVPVMNSAPARGKDWGAYSRTYRWIYIDGDYNVSSRLRVTGQYRRLELLTPTATAYDVSQPVVVLAYDSSLLVKHVDCQWTSPQGETTKEVLNPQGDWAWYGTFTPRKAGLWKCRLQATDSAGDVWIRNEQVHVEPNQATKPRLQGNISWLLGGDHPRRLLTGPSPPLKPLWVTHTGSTHVLNSSPIVSEGRVFIAVGNPNAHTPGAGLLCLDAVSGRKIWKAESPGGDMRSSLAVHNSVVFAVTGDSRVAAYDSHDGQQIWENPIKDDYRRGRPLAINNTPPIPVAGGLLVHDWRGSQYLLDFKTGEILNEVTGDVGSYTSFAAVRDSILYTVSRGAGAAYKLDTGDLIWKFDEPSRSTSAPVFSEETMLYTASGGVSKRKLQTGELVWRTPYANAGYQNPVPVIWDQQVLVNGVNLRSLDLHDGSVRWQINCGEQASRFIRSRRQILGGSSHPLIAGDLAFFGHDDTSIRAVDAQGKVQWEYRLGTPVKTSPAATGNLLFVHDFAGNLWCFIGSE